VARRSPCRAAAPGESGNREGGVVLRRLGPAHRLLHQPENRSRVAGKELVHRRGVALVDCLEEVFVLYLCGRGQQDNGKKKDRQACISDSPGRAKSGKVPNPKTRHTERRFVLCGESAWQARAAGAESVR